VWRVFGLKSEKKRQLNEIDMDGKGFMLTCHADTGGVDV
jgi:hypothetical protein